MASRQRGRRRKEEGGDLRAARAMGALCETQQNAYLRLWEHCAQLHKSHSAAAKPPRSHREATAILRLSVIAGTGRAVGKEERRSDASGGPGCAAAARLPSTASRQRARRRKDLPGQPGGGEGGEGVDIWIVFFSIHNIVKMLSRNSGLLKLQKRL